VVVVESPAKAKTINKYLGSDYTVLASYGHVRDLPAKDGSVDPDQGFDMKWEVASDSRKHVRAIAEALKTNDTLILATDPDREGEAISWHLQEALASSLKKGKTVRRVTFNAITKTAVAEAMAHPREVDTALVEAYLARRALDYLAEALKTNDTLILATDPDREGEAISWHLQEALASSLKKGKTVRRVTFNAITKTAVAEAMAHPREVDTALVEAYLARRALDYLV